MKPTRLLLALAALPALALAACTDVPEPTAVGAPAAKANVIAAPAQEEGQLVVFRGGRGIPSDFADRVAELGGEVYVELAPIGVAAVRGLSAEALATLKARADVAGVEPDSRIATRARSAEPQALSSLASAPSSALQPQTAILYGRQWNMRAIGADGAWAAGRLGSSAVTVAILDSGIDPTGLDLAGRVDLARSRSFMPQDDAIVQAAFPSSHVITDLDGHGTNVASQVVSNGVAFAGVTSQVRLMGVKVCSVYGFCPVSAVLQGIVYATDSGADVINMSLGGGFMKRDCPGCTSTFNRVLNYANGAGVTVVVAAGNDAQDLDHAGNFYSTYCDVPNTICVSATGPTTAGAADAGPWDDADQPAVYTNYGRSVVDVAAPGGNYGESSVAWIWSLCSRTDLNFNPETGQLSYTVCSANPNNVYTAAYVGTSQAAPHVAALAALLVEEHGRNPARIRAAISKSADDLGQRGTDPFYGKGRINVARALGL